MNNYIMLKRAELKVLDKKRDKLREEILYLEDGCKHREDESLLVNVCDNLYKCKECGGQVTIGRDWTYC